MPLRSADSVVRPSSANVSGHRRSRLTGEAGQALLETAITLPLVLLVAVSIFEFGRAYQTAQVLTNAAREGARLAVLPGSTPEQVQARVTAYMRGGQLQAVNGASVSVNQAATVSIGATATAGASVVTSTSNGA